MKQFGALVLVLLVVFTTGCNRQSYLAEKEMYNAQKVLKGIAPSDIQKDPKTALAPAIAAYQKVADKYPTSGKASEALFSISDMKAASKDFEGARAALAKVLQNFSNNGELAANARFRIAQLYEVEGDWKTAEGKYWEVSEYNALTNKGLTAPLYVIAHYKREKDTVNQKYAYEKTVKHFKNTYDSVGPIQAAASLKNALALTHLAQGKIPEARAEWLQLVEQFPDSPYAPLALITVAEYSWKADNYTQAFADYGWFFERYPKHALAGKTAIQVGMLHQSKKEYPQAREWFEKALNQYFQKSSEGEQADLKLLIGRTYQDEGNWEAAARVYEELENNYSKTSAGLQVPFMEFLHYNEAGKPEKAKEVLDEAIVRYKQIAEETPKTKLTSYAKRFILQAYTQKQDWAQLMATVDQELQGETSVDAKGRWLFLKALIAENRLKDREQASIFYQDFLTQYPEHPLVKIAKSHLEGLSKPQAQAPVSNQV